MKTSTRLSVASVALVLGTLLNAAHAADIRTAAQEGAYPKYAALETDGKTEIGGLCVDIMRIIERHEPGIRFVGDQSWKPMIRIEAEVARGQLDAACGLIRTAEREAKYGFIDAPLFPVNYFLAVRADDNIQVKTWADVVALGDKGVVLSVAGFGVLSHLRSVKGLQIDSGGRDPKINFDKLMAGRGRFFIHRSPGIEAEIAKAGMQDKVRVLPNVIHSEVFYMAVSNTLASDVKARLHKAIVDLNASGDIAVLVKKWNANR